MEFMLCEALPIYSGGLGNVAGDQLRRRRPGCPGDGVGILYSQGYFRQIIDRGGPEGRVSVNDPGQLPITPVRRPNGEWLRFKLELPGHPVWLRRGRCASAGSSCFCWTATMRRTTRETGNHQRAVRGRSGNTVIAGTWCWESAAGACSICSHGSRSVPSQRRPRGIRRLERARTYMQKTGQPFDVALAVTRAGTCSRRTRGAGGLRPIRSRADSALSRRLRRVFLGLSTTDLLALGRVNAAMRRTVQHANLAVRVSGGVNGVSGCMNR